MPYRKTYHFYENIYIILTYLNRKSQFFCIYFGYKRILLKQNFTVSLRHILISTWINIPKIFWLILFNFNRNLEKKEYI